MKQAAEEALVTAWRLERLGAAYFEGLASVTTGELTGIALDLWQLEIETADQALTILHGRGIRPEAPTDVELAAAAKRGAAHGWRGFMASLPAGVPKAMELYRSMAVNDPSLKPIAEQLIEHERRLERIAASAGRLGRVE